MPAPDSHPTYQQLVLIGYRGTGKSTVARHVAAKLEWRWMDADVEIERRAGMSIADLFEQRGEQAFRDLEVAVLTELAAQQNLVVAAGGGAVMRAETRQAWQRHSSAVIWLQATPEVLLARINADAATATRRPKLTTLGDAEEIARLMAEREPWYRGCAQCAVNTQDQTPDQVAEEIVVWFVAHAAN